MRERSSRAGEAAELGVLDPRHAGCRRPYIAVQEGGAGDDGGELRATLTDRRVTQKGS